MYQPFTVTHPKDGFQNACNRKSTQIEGEYKDKSTDNMPCLKVIHY